MLNCFIVLPHGWTNTAGQIECLVEFEIIDIQYGCCIVTCTLLIILFLTAFTMKLQCLGVHTVTFGDKLDKKDFDGLGMLSI